ncbi:hypothetical protein J1605_015924 [Eschrichtius robustus]|uniref:Uncharacterized protein n=1 Tax=Eschrichtius robustus TaxID=9764 RepID=A0AB34GAX8_ESCRO|nr:hypothetical protein J1605_015924 [Eschrichtius robustus]
MIFQEFDQDDVCTHSILISEKGDPSGDGQDWQPRTEGICLLSLICQITSVHQEWVPAHSVSLPNEIEMVGSRTKMVTRQPLLLKKEEHYQELCNVNLGFLLPRPCLKPNISKSVAREDVPHFLKGQPRKSEAVPSSFASLLQALQRINFQPGMEKSNP